MKTTIHPFVAAGISVLLAACGGGGSGGNAEPAAYSCPDWNLGDSMTYLRTETVDGLSSETEANRVVTALDQDSVSTSDGETARLFTSGESVPLSELGTIEYWGIGYSTTTYSSQTPLCPPPAVGDTYESQTWAPSPFGRGGEYFETTATVTEVVDEAVSVPAGDYTARKIVMDKMRGSTASTLTRYFVEGVGVVKEVEEIPLTATTVTEELKSFDHSAPALGTADNPIVVTAGTTYADFFVLSYVARVGTGALHIKLEGLFANAVHTLTLTELADNADLHIYSDAGFSALVCNSTEAGALDESCDAKTSAAGELYIEIDGSPSAAGTDFALRASIPPASTLNSRLVISEIMKNPESIDDLSGEWIEIYNPGTDAVELNGCVLSDAGSDAHTIGSSLSAPAGGYVTLAAGAAPGFSPDYVYDRTRFALGNGDDEVILSCGGAVVDRVDYDTVSFPDPAGASLSLDPAQLDENANDAGANWCAASSSYNGDLGTPGGANENCSSTADSCAGQPDGTSCSLPRATAICSGGACIIASCDSGFLDANGIPYDGCETIDLK